MKKFFLFLVMSLFFINVNAQWRESFIKGDELKETENCYANIYNSSNGYFVCWSDDTSIKIGTNVGMFDYDIEYSSYSYISFQYTNVIIGFYVGSTLTEKVMAEFYVPDGDENTAFTSDIKNEGLGVKIINHIKTKGSVRIIARKYSGADFDIVIPMNSNLKCDKLNIIN